MDHPVSSSVAEPSVQKFLEIPYNQRWEYLKDTIIRIYMTEDKTMEELEKEMKDNYSFYASIQQYKYHFRKWGIKKNIVAQQKDAAIGAIAKRRLPPDAITPKVVIHQGNIPKTVGNKRIKRHIHESIRQSEQLTLTPGLFLRHDLPFAALFRRYGGANNPSPVAGPSTPEDMVVGSPQAGMSPPVPQSLIQRKAFLDRARLFLEGREEDLLSQLNRDEKKSTATWLHDFWMYSFMTAKYWGRGPRTWTLSSINFKSFAGHPVPSTPNHHITLGEPSESSSPTAIVPLFDGPTQLCRWSIHYEAPRYEKIPSPPAQSFDEPEEPFGIDNESTWTQWRTIEPTENLADTIRQGLQQNVFSSIQPESLPLDVDSIVKTVERSPKELQEEAFSFAIMSRNMDTIIEAIDIVNDRFQECYSTIFPFHLAATYLDGGKTCCKVMDLLVQHLDGPMSIGVRYIDKSGLTVLDTLFVTIIRSHSTVQPQVLGNAFTGQTRYPGQEVDPCGRWDADSPCIRHLYASGEPKIPRQWKHVFCHTSVQAICHCIGIMFGRPWRPNINTPSGLFLKRCGHCGLELKVGPLHALVLTAFCLANDGMPGENLFGIIACLVCLLTFRADPCATAKVSISMLLGHGPEDDCQHPEMNPAELALELLQANTGAWTSEIGLGWKVLIAILQHDIARRRDNPTQSEEDDCVICKHEIHRCEKDRELLVHCGNRLLGTTWALTQAELLTYRRLNEDEPWLSPRFNMHTLLKGLESDDEIYLKKMACCVDEGGDSLLQDYSCCGLFNAADVPLCPRREEACTSYYANMDDWKRTTFIDVLDWR